MQTKRSSSIPTFSLDNLAKKEGVFFIETKEDTNDLPLHLPYRTDYYGFGIVLKGEGLFNINLESYKITKRTVLSIPPSAIKQWLSRSNDLKVLTVFFNRAFFLQHIQSKNRLEALDFFQLHTQHVINTSVESSDILERMMLEIKRNIATDHEYKDEIVANLLNILFFEYSVIYKQQVVSKEMHLNRGQQINANFKKLVMAHALTERSVKFYAEKLFISSQHLTETIKAETGKSAGKWIAESIVLEAKILLQNAALTIANIADNLHFSDQSAFGKFFKNKTGMSPLVYRQSL